MGVTRSGFSAKRCAVRVMLLRSGILKPEGRWEILVFDDAIWQPSVYIHDVEEILLVIHVDDFLAAASQDALDWIRGCPRCMSSRRRSSAVLLKTLMKPPT